MLHLHLFACHSQRNLYKPSRLSEHVLHALQQRAHQCTLVDIWQPVLRAASCAGLSLCNETAPVTVPLKQQLMQDCNVQACSVSTVLEGAWSDCNSTCGGGVQSRRLVCARDSIVVPNAQCSLEDDAFVTQVRRCRLTDDARVPHWADKLACQHLHGCNSESARKRQGSAVALRLQSTSVWATPEVGTMVALLHACVVFVNKFALCHTKLSLTGSVQTCNTQACAQYQVVAGPWGVCTTACGSGVQQRSSKCIDAASRAAVPMSMCVAAGMTMPRLERPCNTQACASSLAVWTVERIGPCDPAVCSGAREQEVGCRCATGCVS